jgi:urease accessory protein
MMSGRTAVLSPTPDRTDEALDPSQLYRLMAWLSPSFPVGAFSYSSGLEWAVEAGDLTEAGSFQRWLRTVIAHGNGFCDGVFFVQSYRAAVDRDEALLHSVAELAAAFTPSKERQLETTAQGQAFLQTVRAAWSCDAVERFADSWGGAAAYPVAVAITAAGHGIPLTPALHAYLHAVAANLISAGVRLIPLGQTDGQRLLAAMQEIVEDTAGRALAAGLDDLGSAAFRADLASMRHESQYTRLFRS